MRAIEASGLGGGRRRRGGGGGGVWELCGGDCCEWCVVMGGDRVGLRGERWRINDGERIVVGR